MTRPPLGARVRVKAIVHRVAPTQAKREWRSYSCKPFEGVYTGYRFKQKGKVYKPAYDWESGYQEPGYFQCESTQEVWLIVTNPRHNPICVFPEDCEVLP